MKHAVMYGAGNIGRGFIGQLFHQSGYEIAFIDVNMAVIDRLNADRSYPVYVTAGDHYDRCDVTDVRGVNGRDAEAIAEAIAGADIMATAVGVNILKFIAAPIAGGVRLRCQRGCDKPLNIIVCENMIEADRYLAGLIKAELTEEEQAYFDRYVGLVEPSIGRMVPATPAEIAEKEPLAVCVEPYCELPVDRDAFKGEIPEIVNLVPFSPFDFFIRRKLFLHNMSHALTAYFGAYQGYTYIWEAAGDPAIRALAGRALAESSRALSAEYGVAPETLKAFSDDLLTRFENRLLGDTVERVGRDTKRKLAAGDRFAGTIALCEKQGVRPAATAAGLGAGLRFAPAGDELSRELFEDAAANGPAHTLALYSGLPEDSEASRIACRVYAAMAERKPLSEIAGMLGL